MQLKNLSALMRKKYCLHNIGKIIPNNSNTNFKMNYKKNKINYIGKYKKISVEN